MGWFRHQKKWEEFRACICRITDALTNTLTALNTMMLSSLKAIAQTAFTIQPIGPARLEANGPPIAADVPVGTKLEQIFQDALALHRKDCVKNAATARRELEELPTTATEGERSFIQITSSVGSDTCSLCPCHCHVQTQVQSLRRMRPVLGSLRFQTNSTVLLGRRGCNFRNYSRGGSAAFRLT
jgi:hypothetical protein